MEEHKPLLVTYHESKGTVFTSFLGIMSTMAGAGILALPASFARTGLIEGIALLLFLALVTYASMHFICECGRFSKEYTYEGLSLQLFGPFGIWSTRLMTLLLLFGVCIMYMVIAMDLLTPIFENYVQRSTIGILFTILVVPLCLPDSIYALRHTNFMVVACLVYITFSLFLRTIYSAIVTPVVNAEPSNLLQSLSHLSFAIPIQGLSFGCQLNGIRAYGELADKKDMLRVNVLVVSLGFVFYAVFGLLGYFCFDGNPPDDLLTGFDKDDTLINGARFSLALCMLFKTPITFQPFREILEMCLLKSSERNMRFRFCSTFVFMTAGCALAIKASSLSRVMDIMGATAGLWIAFSLPGVFLWQTMIVYDRAEYKSPSIFLIAIGLLMTLISLQYVIAPIS